MLNVEVSCNTVSGEEVKAYESFIRKGGNVSFIKYMEEYVTITHPSSPLPGSLVRKGGNMSFRNHGEEYVNVTHPSLPLPGCKAAEEEDYYVVDNNDSDSITHSSSPSPSPSCEAAEEDGVLVDGNDSVLKKAKESRDIMSGGILQISDVVFTGDMKGDYTGCYITRCKFTDAKVAEKSMKGCVFISNSFYKTSFSKSDVEGSKFFFNKFAENRSINPYGLFSSNLDVVKSNVHYGNEVLSLEEFEKLRSDEDHYSPKRFNVLSQVLYKNLTTTEWFVSLKKHYVIGNLIDVGAESVCESVGKGLSASKLSLNAVTIMSAMTVVLGAALTYNMGSAIINGLGHFLDVPIITSVLNAALKDTIIPDIASYAFSAYKIALLGGVGYAAYRAADLSSVLCSSVELNLYSDLKAIVNSDQVLSKFCERSKLNQDVKKHFSNALA